MLAGLALLAGLPLIAELACLALLALLTELALLASLAELAERAWLAWLAWLAWRPCLNGGEGRGIKLPAAGGIGLQQFSHQPFKKPSKNPLGKPS